MKYFKELVRARRSVRQYTEEKISADDVAALLSAALLAPSSKGKRSYEFIAVDEPVLLHQLSECKPGGAKMIEGAPLAIVVMADATASDMWVEDTSAATMNILLQAEDLGLGACWVQVRGRSQEDGTPATQIVREILGIPPHMEVLSIIAVGHKAKDSRAYTDDDVKWEKVYLNRYGEQ